MASPISAHVEPERVSLVRSLEPGFFLLDIFLHLRWETWILWTIEAALVKVHHQPYSGEDSPAMYSANAFYSCLLCDQLPLGSSPTKSKKKISDWQPAVAFLFLFLFHSLLRLTSFLSQNKIITRCELMASAISVCGGTEGMNLAVRAVESMFSPAVMPEQFRDDGMPVGHHYFFPTQNS